VRLRNYLDRWIKNIRPGFKALTFIVYRRIVNHQIIETICDHALTHLNWNNDVEGRGIGDVGGPADRAYGLDV